jgi:hypothetical protein
MSSLATAAQTTRSLEEQRGDFANRRFLAMPLAGTVGWMAVGIAGWLLSPGGQVLTLWIATGSIFYLGILFSRFTGENFFAKGRPKNAFDSLFLHTVVMALLVYAIAVPFLRRDYTSLPLTVGILSGLMWVPFSWIIAHWVGLFHGIARTVLVTAAWYLFPGARFVAIPAVIVLIYLVTIVILEMRWRGLQRRGVVSA